jgi:hypothetical protein
LILPELHQPLKLHQQVVEEFQLVLLNERISLHFLSLSLAAFLFLLYASALQTLSSQKLSHAKDLEFSLW